MILMTTPEGNYKIKASINKKKHIIKKHLLKILYHCLKYL